MLRMVRNLVMGCVALSISLTGCTSELSTRTVSTLSGTERTSPKVHKTWAKDLSRKYARPDYVSAWSCSSEREAIRDLMLQLSVSVNVSSVSLSDRKDLVIHTQTHSRLSTDSVEALNGLILRKNGSCTFVAINPENARDYYKTMARNHEREVHRLFNQLDQSHSSLERFRAAEKLSELLKELRTEHDAMSLFGVKPHRMTISELRFRRMREALSFQVKALEGSGYTSVSQVVALHENPQEEEVISDYLTKSGYRVVDPMKDPAFLIQLSIRKVILPVHPFDPEIRILLVLEGRIVDRKSGKVVRKKTVENEVGANNFGPVNAPYADESVTDSLLEDLLSGLKNRSSDPVMESNQF